MCRDLAVFSIPSATPESLFERSSSKIEVELFLPAKNLEIMSHSLFNGKITEGKILATHFTADNAYLLNHSGFWGCTYNLQGNRQIWVLGWFPRVKNNPIPLISSQNQARFTASLFPSPCPLPQQSIVSAIPTTLSHWPADRKRDTIRTHQLSCWPETEETFY